MDIIEKITEKLLHRLVREQQQRDSEVYPGSFIESSVLEHLYRYWLESELAQLGFTDIQREKLYSDEGNPETKGRRPACDLIATYKSDNYWIEIKVAYWNTTYTNEELISDADRLIKFVSHGKKLYLMIFMSRDEILPTKLMKALDAISGNIERQSLSATALPSPEHWGLPSTHVYVASTLLK